MFAGAGDLGKLRDYVQHLVESEHRHAGAIRNARRYVQRARALAVAAHADGLSRRVRAFESKQYT